MTTEEKKVYAYNYYIGKGVSPVHAAAIVGNLAKESNFNTTIVGTADNKGSRGIGQWHSERLGNLKRFAGSNWQNLDKQLDFVLHELNTTEKGAYKELLKTTTVEDATRVFMNKYERPSVNPKINRINDRIKEALAVSGITPTPTQSQQTQQVEQTQTSEYEEFNPYLETNKGGQQTAGEYKEPKEVSQAKQELVQAQNEENFIRDVQATLQPQQQITPDQPNYLQSQELFTLAPVEEIQYIQQPEFMAQRGGEVPVSPLGVYQYPRQEVIVPTNDGRITMKNVDYLILGTDEYGNQQMMFPNQEYQYQGKVIHEIPQIKKKRFSK